MDNRKIDAYAVRLRQADGDARVALAALAVVTAVWLVSGFGLAGTGIVVFHTPLWVFTGLLFPWIAAIIASVILGRRFSAGEKEGEGENVIFVEDKSESEDESFPRKGASEWEVRL